MKTYPLHSISLEQAKQLQFKVIDAVTRNFQGEEVLSLGDLGVVKGLNKPRCTVRVEKVFADTFDAPAALLVRGAPLSAALETATALTDESICRSLWRDTPRRFGVDFEGALPAYIRRVEKIFEA